METALLLRQLLFIRLHPADNYRVGAYCYGVGNDADGPYVSVRCASLGIDLPRWRGQYDTAL